MDFWILPKRYGSLIRNIPSVPVRMAHTFHKYMIHVFFHH